MADKILKSLNFGGADNYFPLPLVTAADNDKILSVVNGEWAAVDAPASGGGTGSYVWSKQETENGKILGYVVGETESDYPDGGWSDGAYYKLFTASLIASGISDWVAIEQTLGTDIKRIYHGNDIWVAGASSSDGGLYYSTDGKTWTQSNITDKSVNDIRFDNNIWVAAISSYGLYYSTDGKTWTQSNITNKSFNSVYYGGGIWVAASNDYGLYYSADGRTWTQSNITNKTGYGAYYGNNIFVTCTGGGLYYSIDGKTWTQSNITDKSFRSVRYGGGIWVASSYSYGLYYSTDGKTWTPSNMSDKWIYCIDYYNGLWLAGTTSSINSILFSSILDVSIELKNY